MGRWNRKYLYVVKFRSEVLKGKLRTSKESVVDFYRTFLLFSVQQPALLFIFSNHYIHPILIVLPK